MDTFNSSPAQLIEQAISEAARIYGVSKEEIRKNHLRKMPEAAQSARRYIACSLRWNHGMMEVEIAAALGYINSRPVFSILREEGENKRFFERKTFTV